MGFDALTVQQAFERPGCVKLGSIFELRDPSGRLWLQNHAGPNQPPRWSVPTETTQGQFTNGSLQAVETILQTFRRCMIEEARIDPLMAAKDLRLPLAQPTHLYDWALGSEMYASTNHTRIAVGLDAAAFLQRHASATKEASGFGFFTPEQVRSLIDEGAIRPGFDNWYQERAGFEWSNTGTPLYCLPRAEIATIRPENGWQDLSVTSQVCAGLAIKGAQG